MQPKKTVVFLSDNKDCKYTQTAAFYLHQAYGDSLQICMYGYQREHFYHFNPNNNSFTDKGYVFGLPKDENNSRLKKRSRDESKGLFKELCIEFDIGKPNDSPVSCKTFEKLGDYAQYSDHMTTLNPVKFSHIATSNAIEVINFIRHEWVGKDNPLCFMIAPNQRNIPARFLTVGHRFELSEDGLNMLFYTNERKVVAVNHLKMENIQVANVLTEVMLCYAIKRENHRFLGNCYGAQVMWLSLGGGLTTYRIEQDEQDSQGNKDRLVLEYNLNEETKFHANLGFDNILLSNNKLTHPEAIMDVNQLYEFFGINHKPAMKCNTDLYHSYMMLLSKRINPDEKAQNYNDQQLFTQKHLLADQVYRSVEDKNVSKQAHIKQLQKYAATPQDFFNNNDKRSNRTSSWVGDYSFSKRIYGFQGHLAHHVTLYSASWNQTAAVVEGDSTSENPHHENNKTLVNWCMFGLD